MPHKSMDATITIAQLIVESHQEINPLESGVVSVGYINGSDTESLNIFIAEVHLGDGIHTSKLEVHDLLERSVDEMTKSPAVVFNCEFDVHYRQGNPPTVNYTKQIEVLLLTAKETISEENVIPNMQPLSSSEDFPFMLEKMPGS